MRQDQEIQLTMTDLENAIKGMKNNKTPGQDGIPIDFYKVFWNNIKETFYSMVLSSYEDAYLHTSARKGILNSHPQS